MNVSYLVLKGILGVCKFIGYKTCAKVAGLTVGKKAVTLGANYVLGGFLPFRIVKYVVAAAPYAPSAVVLATGGTAALATNVAYIVISQLSEYMFVCAVKTAAWEGTKATYRVAKYVFITKPLGLDSGSLKAIDSCAGEILKVTDPLDEGWVLVGEGEDPVAKQGAIYNLLQALTKSKKPTDTEPTPTTIIDISEEDVNASLVLVTKIAEELAPQDVGEGMQLVDEEGIVFEEAWDKSVEQEVDTPKKDEDEFIMV